MILCIYDVIEGGGISMCGNKSVGGGVAMQKKSIPTMGLNNKVYLMVILRQIANLDIAKLSPSSS